MPTVKLHSLTGVSASNRAPNSLIRTSRRFFEGWVEDESPLSLAAQWLHEGMHVTGFYHDDSSGDRNDLSYTIGELPVEIGPALGHRKLVGGPPDDCGGYLRPAGRGSCEATRTR
jgi:hypothetical protein